MTKREKIIEICGAYTKYPEMCADAILALREIDVPTDEEIEAWAEDVGKRIWDITSLKKWDYLSLIKGVKAMRDGEILKRNNK